MPNDSKGSDVMEELTKRNISTDVAWSIEVAVDAVGN
jgi:hypothetical protein